MRVLRLSWPLASAFLIALAAVQIAHASPPATGATAATAEKPEPSSITLLGFTWCMGQPAGVTCDVNLPLASASSPAQATATATPAAATPATEQPGWMQRLRALFGGDRAGDQQAGSATAAADRRG